MLCLYDVVSQLSGSFIIFSEKGVGAYEKEIN